MLRVLHCGFVERIKNHQSPYKMSQNIVKQWTLRNETELRCEVPEGAALTLKLIHGSGSAEIFGIEMAPNKEYTFRDQSIAVFTWYGCVIESIGDPTIPYIADSTPMVAYVNTHIQLEARRDVAMFNKDRGPRVSDCWISMIRHNFNSVL